MPRRSRPWKTLKQELLRDETFRLAYEELEPEFQAALAVIALRATRGLTQEELATRARLQRPVLSRIEGAKAMPTIPTLERLAAALNAKVEIRFVNRKNRPLPRVPSIRVSGAARAMRERVR
jgi:transcriptional regulator with XRE-family HTH domain